MKNTHVTYLLTGQNEGKFTKEKRKIDTHYQKIEFRSSKMSFSFVQAQVGCL